MSKYCYKGRSNFSPILETLNNKIVKKWLLEDDDDHSEKDSLVKCANSGTDQKEVTQCPEVA